MNRQTSDSIPCGILLALSGGIMDAYSYLFRGHVFANAQTGNMLLFGVNLANGEISAAIYYLCPVLAFTAGIVFADIICEKKETVKIHWRQISVIIEALFLTAVAFIPEDHNAAANALTSLACGMQLESFKKIHGNSLATTMCIGNLRSGTYNLDRYFSTHEKSYLGRAGLYFGINLVFIAGAVIESFAIKAFGTYAIILSPVMLLIALFIMFRDPDKA